MEMLEEMIYSQKLLGGRSWFLQHELSFIIFPILPLGSIWEMVL